MRKIAYFCLALLVFAACRQDEFGDWQETNLLACCQLPISVMAPDSVDIKSSKLGGLYQDITLRKGSDYFVQIYASDANTNDIARIKSDQLEQVRALPYFSRVVEEEEQGFLYENVIDSTNINYSFRYVALVGDKEFIFQPGLTGLFTEGEARRMYEAVKQ